MCRLVGIIGLLFCNAAFAGSSSPDVTKIVCRFVSPQIPPQSFSAKPRTMYIAGVSYSRVEEEPDSAHGIHGLIVITEPDSWLINLVDHSGHHVVDSGPTFIVHHLIMSRDAPKEFANLEFGKEMKYLQAHHARKLAARVLDRQQCEAFEVEHDKYRLVLFSKADTHLPLQLEVYRQGKIEFIVKYLSYQTHLPFNGALFKPPPGTKITEESRK